MDTYRDNRNRRSSQMNFSDLINTLSTPVLGKLTIIPLLPVLWSCSDIGQMPCPANDPTKEIPLEIAAVKSPAQNLNTLDLFTFNDDRLARFDAYLRTEGNIEDTVRMMSGRGEKIIFACANSQRDRYDWADISSLSSLEKINAYLEKERRNALLMTAVDRTRAGSGEPCWLILRPLVCEVLLRSVRCDFTDKAYEGAEIEDASVYLTNVNAQCSLTAEGTVMPARVMNLGALSMEDIAEFHDPDLIYRKIDEDIGKEASETGISLLCYPNSAIEESPGSPFTRLVIEGCIEGERFWWPIDINRDGSVQNPGLHRNCSYVFDIVIRRKGSRDPDTPIETNDIDIKMHIEPWMEKEGYSVSF